MMVLRNKRGEGYLDTAIQVLASCIVLALALAVYPVVIGKFELNRFADDLKRQVEITGQTGTIEAVIQSLKEDTKLNPNIHIDANTIDGSRIQFGDQFTITLTHDFDIGFGPFGSWPITLPAKATGKSEVYW